MTQKLTLLQTALRRANIPSVRGFSPQTKPELTGPAAVVTVQRITAQEICLAAEIYCPATIGGTVCENAAYAAYREAVGLGARCTQEACMFDKSLGLFVTRLLVSWVQAEEETPAQPEPERTLACQVTVDGTGLPYVTQVTAEKKVQLCPVGQLGAGMLEMRWEDVHWDITLEELLPPDAPIEDTGTATFTLEILRSSGTEQYTHCRWASVRRKDTPQGIQQTRIVRTWEARRDVNGTDDL